MSEPTAAVPVLVVDNLLSLRVWCAAAFGGFVLGALPFSLLALLWHPLGEIAVLTGPIAVLAILYVACLESPQRHESSAPTRTARSSAPRPVAVTSTRTA